MRAICTALSSRSSSPRLDVRDQFALDARVDRHDRPERGGAREGRLGGLGVAVHPHDDLLARFDARDALGLARHQPALQFLDRGEGAAAAQHVVEFDLGGDRELVHLGVHDLGAGEDVGVLQQVALEREDLLEAQAPLLVPRSGQAERLVPRRQLQGTRTRVGRERHPEHLEHDALDVVLRLLFGEPERVHLDAVAEASKGRVLDAVASATDLVPHRGEGSHLGDLLDEPDPRVDEERDAPNHARHLARRDLARVAHRVQDVDRGGESVGDLLDRGGAGLLEVVAADVDRIPLGHVVDREGDHVHRETPRGLGREDVGAAAQVLLDDVVLGGARQRGVVNALLVGERQVEAPDPRRGGVDRHRGVHLGEGYAGQQLAHVAEVGDRHPDLADLARRQGRVGVVAGLGRQVERDGEAGLALVEVAPV